MMPVRPPRCRLASAARVGLRRVRRSDRQRLAEEGDRPQLALRAVAQREILLLEQPRERFDEWHSVEFLAHVAWLAHMTHDLGTALPSDLSHDVGEGYPPRVHRDLVSVVCDHACRLPRGERPGREHQSGDYRHATLDYPGHEVGVYDAASRAGKPVFRGEGTRPTDSSDRNLMHVGYEGGVAQRTAL